MKEITSFRGRPFSVL